MSGATTGPIYRSNADLPKVVEATLCGLPLIFRSDDREIVAEMRRRGVWAGFERDAKIGRAAMLLDQTLQGLDAFIWEGNPSDGGFSWLSVIGGRVGTPVYFELLAMTSWLMKGPYQARLSSKQGAAHE